MQYFGRNPFVMNILRTSISLKTLILSSLCAGNGGDPTRRRRFRQGKRNGYGCGYDAAVRISVIFGGAKKERMVRPEGVELPTLWFEAKCSIQLSYGRGKADNKQ